MARSPREVAELVRQMVAGEGVVFANLFAEDGVLRFPFAPPGMPREIRGREAIRASGPPKRAGVRCSRWTASTSWSTRPTIPRWS